MNDIAYEFALLNYRIVYSRLDHDYTCFVTIDEVEQPIGSRGTHHDAETHCREYLYNYYADNHTPEVAARIAIEAFDPTSPGGV